MAKSSSSHAAAKAPTPVGIPPAAPGTAAIHNGQKRSLTPKTADSERQFQRRLSLQQRGSEDISVRHSYVAMHQAM